MRLRVIPLCIVLLAGHAGLAGEPGKTRGVAELRSFYQARCARCHGEDGSNRGPDGESLRGSDFTDAKQMQRETDEALAKTIRKGRFFGLAMPAFKEDLTDAEISLLVKEVLRKAEKGRPITATPSR